MTPSDVGVLILMAASFVAGFWAGEAWGYSRARAIQVHWLRTFKTDMKKLTDPDHE